jgi:hypothetical protein
MSSSPSVLPKPASDGYRYCAIGKQFFKKSDGGMWQTCTVDSIPVGAEIGQYSQLPSSSSQSLSQSSSSSTVAKSSNPDAPVNAGWLYCYLDPNKPGDLYMGKKPNGEWIFCNANPPSRQEYPHLWLDRDRVCATNFNGLTGYHPPKSMASRPSYGSGSAVLPQDAPTSFEWDPKISKFVGRDRYGNLCYSTVSAGIYPPIYPHIYPRPVPVSWYVALYP